MKWRRKAGCTLESLKSLRAEAKQMLTSWGIKSEDDLNDLEVIFCELLSNAAGHGNAWHKEKQIAVNMRFCPKIQTVLLLVCDEGQRLIQVAKAEELAEGGRGLLLVEALSTKLQLGQGRVWVRKELKYGEEDTDC